VRSHLNCLGLALGAVLLLALVAPALAAAETFTVNTTVDTETLPAECGASGLEPCVTLRGALAEARDNGHDSQDTITFAAELAGQTIEVEEGSPLPELSGLETIKGDIATPGVPAIGLVAKETGVGIGLTVREGTGNRIEGLAIGGFEVGIEVTGEDGSPAKETAICGDYIGTDLTGVVSVPNAIGIGIFGNPGPAERPEGTQIGGSGCETVISGNSVDGIFDSGLETRIADSRIGLGAEPGGASLGNGTIGNAESAGILESVVASGAVIGGVGRLNNIDNNLGPGVLVESGDSEVTISGNSFSQNEGKGIEIQGGAPSVPLVASATEPSPGEVTISGTVAQTATAEEVTVEFFGSDDCSKIGEGRTVLGSGTVETTVFEPAGFSFTIPALTGTERGYTVTATREAGATSEFSTCATLQSPRTFVVNSLADTETAEECEDGDGPCTLRGAIEAANKTAVRDTIDFAAEAEGTIKVGSELPRIGNPVTIDGTSAPGYAGRPLVLIDGSEVEGEGGPELVEGLVVEEDGGGTLIEGVALGGFSYAVWLNGVTGSQICSSWTGVELDGQTALPDEYGIESGEDAVGNEVGAGCAVGNTVVASTVDGIIDFGSNTEIGGNVIGIDPDGTPMPNGGPGGEGEKPAGIIVKGIADESTIGGTGALSGEPAPNTIAYNDGPGVLVEKASSRAVIRGNKIFGNVGKGIAIEEEAPAVPTIEAVAAIPGGIAVKGAVASGEEEPVELDFYAGAMCEPLSAGEGESFLGSGEIAESKPGSNAFVGDVSAPASDDQTFITVAATGAAVGRTSEFSECFKYAPPEPEPEHHEETKPPAQSSATNPPVTPTLNTSPTSTPTNGEKVVVKPEEGKVLIKLPGTKKYVRLEELKEIPVGAIIDATKGRVTLTSIGPDGKEQTAEFFGGVFKVKQAEGSNLVVLELLDETACPAPPPKKSKKGGTPRAFASSVSLRPSGRTSGKLWGSGHGNFRTEGHAGSATVEGTIWLVEDRCNGTTFFRTRRGIVRVRDFILHKALPLPAGKSYVAGEE
jgi:CSLREA domain-containing protein